MENKIIKNENFYKVASNVKPDVKKRVVLCKEAISEDVTYHVYRNEIGQIILDPQISIPASEVWLYRDAKAHKAVAAGLKDAAEGKVSKMNLKNL
jgi:hypothetical protein